MNKTIRHDDIFDSNICVSPLQLLNTTYQIVLLYYFEI